MVHRPALHPALPCAGAGHGAQRVPQVATWVSSAHVAPQAWKPWLHPKPHCFPSHVVTPSGGGGGHGVHDVPHVSIDVLSKHCEPHEW
jgi:hypothetical protein